MTAPEKQFPIIKLRTVLAGCAGVFLALASARVAGQAQPAARMGFEVKTFSGTSIGPVAGMGTGFWLEAKFHNYSDREVFIPWGYYLYDDMFHFTITGPDGKSVTGPTDRPAPPVLLSEREFVRVGPGMDVSFEIQIGGVGMNVQPWYLRKPGKYLLNVEYTSARDRYFDPATSGTIQVSNVWQGTLKSPPVSFTVATNAAYPQGGPGHKILDQPGIAIRGQVLDEFGKPITNALIEVTAVRTNDLLGNSTLPFQNFLLDRCLTDAQGRYAVDSLPDDVAFYSVLAKHPLYVPATVEVAHTSPLDTPLANGSTSRNLELRMAKTEANFVLGKGAEFRGRVVDSADLPVYGARIDTGLSAKTVYSDQNGFFTLTGIRTKEDQFRFWRPGLKDAQVTEAKPYQGGEVTWQIVLGPDTKKKVVHQGPSF
jgi:hypothetical protein